MRFRFLKVSVSINLSYWVFLFLIIASLRGECIESFLWSIVFTFSILLHEYGHALAALVFRAEPIIVLEAFGGRTFFDTSNITAKQRFLVTLAGPLLQALFALVAYLLLRFSVFNISLLNDLLFFAFQINIRWLLLNLIPIAPLDGGTLLGYLLQKKFGHKGYIASLIIGLVAAALAIPYFYFQGYHWFFILQLFISGWNYCKLLQKEQES